MASWLESFEASTGDFGLGLAGLEDLVGLTDHRAVDVYLTQTGEAQHLTEQQKEMLREQSQTAVKHAADETVDDLKSVAESAASEVGKIGSNLISPLIFPALIVVAGLALWFLGPAIAQLLAKKD